MTSRSNVFLQIKPLGKRQENVTNQCKTFKHIQSQTLDKENIKQNAQHNDKLLEADTAEATLIHRAIVKIDAEIQSDLTVTADLTSDHDASVHYYKRLSEQRRNALERTLLENQQLNERIDCLEEELDTSRKELDEAVHLTEILKEFLNESDKQTESYAAA